MLQSFFDVVLYGRPDDVFRGRSLFIAALIVYALACRWFTSARQRRGLALGVVLAAAAAFGIFRFGTDGHEWAAIGALALALLLVQKLPELFLAALFAGNLLSALPRLRRLTRAEFALLVALPGAFFLLSGVDLYARILASRAPAAHDDFLLAWSLVDAGILPPIAANPKAPPDLRQEAGLLCVRHWLHGEPEPARLAAAIARLGGESTDRQADVLRCVAAAQLSAAIGGPQASEALVSTATAAELSPSAAYALPKVLGDSGDLGALTRFMKEHARDLRAQGSGVSALDKAFRGRDPAAVEAAARAEIALGKLDRVLSMAVAGPAADQEIVRRLVLQELKARPDPALRNEAVAALEALPSGAGPLSSLQAELRSQSLPAGARRLDCAGDQAELCAALAPHRAGLQAAHAQLNGCWFLDGKNDFGGIPAYDFDRCAETVKEELVSRCRLDKPVPVFDGFVLVAAGDPAGGPPLVYARKTSVKTGCAAQSGPAPAVEHRRAPDVPDRAYAMRVSASYSRAIRDPAFIRGVAALASPPDMTAGGRLRESAPEEYLFFLVGYDGGRPELCGKISPAAYHMTPSAGGDYVPRYLRNQCFRGAAARSGDPAVCRRIEPDPRAGAFDVSRSACEEAVRASSRGVNAVPPALFSDPAFLRTLDDFLRRLRS